ncbi:MAG: cytochrome c oxidase assembly protein [Gemmatimonadota bacterium]|nr:MAG: cytochrome c oxidase assembly protein [Gemmatimonadota bacterium]
MRWWCASSRGVAWDWTWQPYIGVWALVALLAVFYWLQVRKLPIPESPTERSRRRRQAILFGGGALALWSALDWPLGPLGSGYLASVHMVQYLLLALIGPPLLLLGLPGTSYDKLRAWPRALTVLRNTTQPLVAFFIFNVAVTVTHWPSLVDPLMRSQVGSFVLDISWLLAGIIFWWPLISPVPEWPRFAPIFKMAYLGLNGIMIRPPFFILLFSKFPAYATYELAPPIPGTSALSDQQLAAGIMKLGSALIMVVAMVLVFSDWVRSSQRQEPARADRF